MKPQSGPDTAAKDWPPKWTKRRPITGRPLKRYADPYRRHSPGRGPLDGANHSMERKLLAAQADPGMQ